VSFGRRERIGHSGTDEEGKAEDVGDHRSRVEKDEVECRGGEGGCRVE